MLLRAAIVILLMLNLGAAAWWLARPRVVDASVGRPAQVDGPSLRLVGEPMPAAPVMAPVASAPTAAIVAAPPSEQAASVANAPVCLRFGPFADGTARDAARTALSAAGVAASPRDTAARSARGWKVSMPPFASREEATAMAERIKAAGINDLYVMGEGPEANSIALGRFGGEEAARRREAELRAKGFPAQASPLGGNPAQWWLDVRLSANADRAAVAAFGPSRPVACDTLR